MVTVQQRKVEPFIVNFDITIKDRMKVESSCEYQGDKVVMATLTVCHLSYSLKLESNMR